jgi:hypothetical protein
MNGTFVAGLKDDRIKYIVKARGKEDSLAVSRDGLARRKRGQITKIQREHWEFDMAELRILRKFNGLQTQGKKRSERSDLC